MKALVACEYSGRVRDALSNEGWDAWSCDILPTESEMTIKEGKHIQADVLSILDNGWDLMIAHPPCTYLTVAGNRYISCNPDRWQKQVDALKFVYKLMNAPIRYIAIENPVGVISTYIRKPDEIIQPWQFGHPESKRTCLWLKNLPKLIPTLILPLPECGIWENQMSNGQNRVIENGKIIGWNNKRIAHLRSKTYIGIAQAMAEQWTHFITTGNIWNETEKNKLKLF